MAKVFRYRLKPTKAQIAKLNEQLELCRWVYNKTLAIRRDAFKQEGRSVSYFETKRMLPIWKESKPELSMVHSQVLQDVVLRVNLAFKAFFRRVLSEEEDPGYPRFKGKNRYDSISYPQSGFSIDDNKLWLSKIGEIKFWLHRPIEGYVKRLTIRRSATNKWYVSFLVEESVRAHLVSRKGPNESYHSLHGMHGHHRSRLRLSSPPEPDDACDDNCAKHQQHRKGRPLSKCVHDDDETTSITTCCLRSSGISVGSPKSGTRLRKLSA